MLFLETLTYVKIGLYSNNKATYTYIGSASLTAKTEKVDCTKCYTHTRRKKYIINYENEKNGKKKL